MVEVALLALADCVAGCVNRGYKKNYTPLKMRVFLDDITALLVGKTEMWLK